MPSSSSGKPCSGVDPPDARLRDWLAGTEDIVEPGAKGWPADAWGRDAEEIRRLGLRVADLPTPVVTLDRDVLAHNVRRMARYCREHGVSLAPHAKTAMAPAIVRLQLREGAWGVTAATWAQARLLWAAGCRRILLANQLLEPEGLRWVSNAGREDVAQVLCFVDSLDGVDSMRRVLAPAGTGAHLGVLVEVGLAGGRTGARTVGEALAVARAAANSPGLRLRGVAAYEGIAIHDRRPAELDRVHTLLSDVRTVTKRLLEEGLYHPEGDVIVTAGGSAAFDEVVAALAPLAGEHPGLCVLLRSGCYASHDSAFYERVSPLAGPDVDGSLRAALALYSRILSRGEPARAVADFGKRDTSFDLGMPVVRRVLRAGRDVTGEAGRPGVAELYDQHAVLDVEASSSLAVGDVLECGISHPCTTFDRWRCLPLVAGDERVVGVLRTYF